MDLRSYLLSVSPEATLHYTLGAFHAEAADGSLQSCSLIPIAEVGDRILVAVPHNAWHRVANRRFLPRTALTKATHCEVLAADPLDRASAHKQFKVRLWLQG